MGSSKRLSCRANAVSIIVKPTAVKPYFFRNDIRNPKPSNSIIMISRNIMYSYITSPFLREVFVQVKNKSKRIVWEIPKTLAKEQTIMVGGREEDW